MKATIISSAALAAMVAAAPIADATKPPGTGVMFLNGEPMNLNSPTAAHGPCSPDDDVEQCAKKIAASWTLPGNATSTENSMTWKGTCTLGQMFGGGVEDCEITLPYTAKFQNCRMQDPVLTQISPDGAFDCNSGESCQSQMSFGTVSTNTTADGYKIGAQLSASASIGFVSTSLQVSADFSENWSNTQTATTSETRTYNISPGSICNPTTVQFRTECDINVESTFNGAEEFALNHVREHDLPAYQGPYGDFVWVHIPNMGIGEDFNITFPLHLCSSNENNEYDFWYQNNPSSQIIKDFTFEGKDKICEAIQNPAGVAMDVSAGLRPWALQGCMFT